MPWGRGRGRGFGRGWFGRGGYGFWAQATGMPGWMRASYGLPAYGRGWPAFGYPGWSGRPTYSRMYTGYGVPAMPYGFVPGWGRGGFRGNPFSFCRWFPWLPRWWWSGMHGPVQWTPQGPILTSQQIPTAQPTYPTSVVPYRYPYQAPTAPAQPVNEIEFLKQEKQMLLDELKYIEERLKELGGEL